MEKFAAPVRALKDVTNKLIRREIPMSPDRVNDLFAHITGMVQQLLDSTREELGKNFRNLTASAQDSDAPPDVLAYLTQFDELQKQINQGLLSFSEVIGSARDPRELEQRQHVLDYVTTNIQTAVDQLAIMTVETGNPVMLTVGEPLPEGVVATMDNLERALGALDRYIDERSAEALMEVDECLRDAREALAPLLPADVTTL